MHIDRVVAIPLRVPVTPTRSALGEFTSYNYGLVIVRTDAGLTGFGEISTLWDGAGEVQCGYVNHFFAERLVGRDPLDIVACLGRLRTLAESAEPARAGVDIALHDLAGKILGQPVYQLLGGRTRTAIPQSRSITMGPMPEMITAAESAVSAGYGCVKVKVGQGRETDLTTVAAIRSAIGDSVLLRVDANMAWATAKDAVANIRGMEKFELHSVEQPMPRRPLAEWRLLRERVDVPIMLDESIWGPQEAWQFLAGNATDMINVYVAEAGGLHRARLIFELADLVGIPCVIGSMPELGIGTAAAIHLATSVGTLDHPCDTAGSTYHQTDIVTDPILVRDGCVAAGDGPGLGINLDWDAISALAVDRAQAARLRAEFGT